MRTEEMDQFDQEISRARCGRPEAYADVLERAFTACQGDAQAAKHLDVLELHNELADTYDRLGRVQDALRHADVLVEQGYACSPDPRCRRAEILTRHGRLEEAAAIWDAVASDTPEDVWVYNNAGLEYGAIGQHEAALSWLTRGLEVDVRTGDRERLTVAWLPADEYPDWATHWPDPADSDLVREDKHGGSVPHAVYCRRMERRLLGLLETGAARPAIAPVRAAEFDQWVADHESHESDPVQLRAQYAADLGQDPSRTVAWPPEPNEPCWCGSGRKYKKCCGAPDLGEPR